MVLTEGKKLDSLDETVKWVQKQVNAMNIVAIAEKLTIVPCPFAYGSIKCNINSQCIAKVVRKKVNSNGIQFLCYYEDLPVVSEEVIIPVTAGLIGMYLTEDTIIDRIAKVLYYQNTGNRETECEMFLFSSSYLARLIISKDTCISCLYRNEVKRQKNEAKSR
ncbi:MAG: hypothetical protein ACTSRU_09980 [Candidatus Hodarchaeales archaeon]